MSFIKHRPCSKDVVNFFLSFLQGIDVDAENCAVCIENFKVKDIIRILPCKYVFYPSRDATNYWISFRFLTKVLTRPFMT